jgi:LAS superfamily LD-carboxypeptidase LdcB
MQLVRLTADRIVDLSRFVAIVPNEENHSYSLILEGSDRDIPIYQDDLNILTKYLNAPKIETQTQYNLADLAKPQATEILKARIARHEAMSDEESEVRAAAWERFKQNIDADRSDGSKLYS